MLGKLESFLSFETCGLMDPMRGFVHLRSQMIHIFRQKNRNHIFENVQVKISIAFCLGATHSSPQSLFLTPSSGIIPGQCTRDHGQCQKSKPEQVSCKKSTLIPALSLWPEAKILFSLYKRTNRIPACLSSSEFEQKQILLISAMHFFLLIVYILCEGGY